MGQVAKNKRNQNTFTLTDERSANAQKTAMPKETISAHGIVKMSRAANKIPKALLADEEFKEFRTHGTAKEKKDAKQNKHTITEQNSSTDTTFDWNQ